MRQVFPWFRSAIFDTARFSYWRDHLAALDKLFSPGAATGERDAPKMMELVNR